jgi:hypothetical protein
VAVERGLDGLAVGRPRHPRTRGAARARGVLGELGAPRLGRERYRRLVEAVRRRYGLGVGRRQVRMEQRAQRVGAALVQLERRVDDRVRRQQH